MIACSIEVSVRAVTRLADDVNLFELERSDGAALPAFTAGSHIDVEPQPGVVRQYSLCNGPAERDRYLVAVRLARPSRAGSAAMHRLQAGSRLRIGEPRNAFPLSGEGFSLLLGAGIGITPLFSMARHLQASGRAFAMRYFSRNWPAAFESELLAMGDGADVAVEHGLGHDRIREQIGAAVAAAPEGTTVYVCGPEGFMAAACDMARELRPQLPVRIERFAPAPPDTDGSAGFRVQLRRSGFAIDVAPGQSILQSLRDRGVWPEVSCEAGICGTCVTAVLEGTPLHRDDYLTEEEKAAGRCMCICVSGSRTPVLALDL